MDQENKKPITIKRYSNRKLYDTSQSRYITLAELGELIRRGENIEVIDNETKADLTEMTLTQILIAQQKQKQNGIRNLVQTQAEILLQRISVPMQQIRDEALRQVEKQVSKFTKKQETPANSDSQTQNPTISEADDHPTPSLLNRLESLRASSDEKLLSLLLVQRLEQLESEVAELKAETSELKRRLELLERKDDDTY
ncbi:MAG: hypothetical protein J6A01_03545 [Proteobacteria bacterium]|nr:hypothetical protein [Pseudomonadota bacterium]